jgi:hypothetical protein
MGTLLAPIDDSPHNAAIHRLTPVWTLFIAANNQLQSPSPKTMCCRRRDATRSRQTKTNDKSTKMKC